MDPKILAKLTELKEDPAALGEFLSGLEPTAQAAPSEGESKQAESQTEAPTEPETVAEPKVETVTKAEEKAEEPEPEPVAETKPEPEPEPNPLEAEYRNLLVQHHNVPEGLVALLPESTAKLKAYLESEGYKQMVKVLQPAPQPPKVETPELPDRGKTSGGPDFRAIGTSLTGI